MKYRTISHAVFTAIRNDLLNTDHHMADIAKKHGVGATSVSNINLEANWGNHQAHKRAKQSLRSRRKAEVAALSKLERALTAGLKPHTAEDRKEAMFARELGELAATPTRDEFDALDKGVNSRIAVLHKRIRAEEEAGSTGRFAAFCGFVVLLVLVIIALVK